MISKSILPSIYVLNVKHTTLLTSYVVSSVADLQDQSASSIWSRDRYTEHRLLRKHVDRSSHATRCSADQQNKLQSKLRCPGSCKCAHPTHKVRLLKIYKIKSKSLIIPQKFSYAKKEISRPKNKGMVGTDQPFTESLKQMPKISI